MLCVRWYLRYKLSFRDLVEMMAERGLSLAHTTIMRWIQRYAPEFEKRWNRFARPVGQSWRVDETYVKIKGRWTYLYRAVDKEGKTRGLIAIERDLMRQSPLAPERPSEERLGRGEHPEGNRCAIRSSKYLNNLIEQDHRSITLRLGPMLGLKRFRRAATTIAGIELMHRIRKVSSGSASFASRTRPRPKFGTPFSPRDPRQAPERFLAPISSICTTASS